VTVTFGSCEGVRGTSGIKIMAGRRSMSAYLRQKGRKNWSNDALNLQRPPSYWLPTSLSQQVRFPQRTTRMILSVREFLETSGRTRFEELPHGFPRKRSDSCEICPDLGGRVCSIFLKEMRDRTLFFRALFDGTNLTPTVFHGGGIELSFPISHSPVSGCSRT